jgi:plastocyanin
MVFAVNPGDKFAQFQQNAAASSTQASQTTPSSGTSLSVSSPSPTPSPVVYASTTTDHRVIVGGPNLLLYTPSNITAQPGDTVTFEFRVKNHTATQSAFATPCRPLADTTGKIGFDSGFMPVANDATVFPTYTVKINDTAPVWVYCRQTGHCGMGMVFSVNADEKSTNTFEAFRANAIKQNGTAPATGSA